ncbi:hypothetical protein BT96DRAFT_920996 [Gymnopus androsaceus JB14]|uniref:Uncharacterized protein n=1 Tax=Gymnopus androsaceus JB14 TaxID=1447944 RepID=A0A6A4HKY0_9AGAR|nr:hypothetical protein BT96DRAFT_920996 [Gymnopus androsaceus JB14]
MGVINLLFHRFLHRAPLLLVSESSLHRLSDTLSVHLVRARFLMITMLPNSWIRIYFSLLHAFLPLGKYPQLPAATTVMTLLAALPTRELASAPSTNLDH